MNDQHALTQAVIAGRRREVPDLVNRCLDAGESPSSILENRLVPGMMIVGESFKRNEIFVPEILISAWAMKEAFNVLEPFLLAAGVKTKHTAIIGTVEGDLHDIGKSLITMMWKSANIGVIDLGVNVSAAKFAEAVKRHKPQLVGLSALLTTTMPAMRDAVKAIRCEGFAVRIVVGGAPVTSEFARAIGADGYSPTAGFAASVAFDLLKGLDPVQNRLHAQQHRTIEDFPG